MTTFRLPTGTLAVAFVLIGLADTSAARADCSAPANQLEMNVCAAEAYKAADARLNQVWRTLRADMDEGEKQAMLDSQRAWLTFRDANCAFAVYANRGGSIAQYIEQTCLADMTRHRIDELEYLSGP